MDLELQVQTKRIDSGVYEVTFARPEAPLDVQESAFTANRLHNVSPAELAFLRVNVQDGTFDLYSRTRGRVIHDDRDDGRGHVVFPEGIGSLVSAADLVKAHRANKECIIPTEQSDEVYALIDTALRNGDAVRVGYGRIGVPTDRFGEEGLTSRLYTKPTLGANAKDYGDYITEKTGRGEQSFFFDSKEYAMKNGLYVNGLRLCGSDSGFNVDGDDWDLDLGIGAFGVRLKKIAEASREGSHERSDLSDAKNPDAQK